VVPVSEVEGKHLDGCFIRTCATTVENLILGALILEQGLENGLISTKKGKRKIVPGSMPILNNLRKHGLTNIYEQAGFTVGIPGCSYCVGMSADRAGEGEVWLSSQNRNFENRMGKGESCVTILTGYYSLIICYLRIDRSLASAATVAASSFDMKITDPCDLLKKIDLD
jgi:homoaconitase/3-isopropylmalate dehydratase large subunit